jgi:hypothetical protein
MHEENGVELFKEGSMKRGFTLFLIVVQSLLFWISAEAKSAEPTLRQLERAALQYSGMDPQEVLRWRSRSRWAAALPHVTVGYDQKADTQINNSIQDSVSVSSAGITVGPPESNFRQDDNFNRGFEVHATWALDELVFNRDSLNISAEARYRTLVRAQILDELHEAYFERKKLLLTSEDPSVEVSPILLRLRLEELEAKLDSLTGGSFSKMMNGGGHEEE